MVLPNETSTGSDDLKDRALWERNVRRARGTVYTPTVRGFRIGGTLWAINKLVKVNDDFAAIKDTMLINSVMFSIDLNAGRTTTLKLVRKDAYTLIFDEPEEDIGGGII